MFITDALSLCIVPRWSIVRTVCPQSVASHSFNVAMITQELLTRHPNLMKDDRFVCNDEDSVTPPRIRPYNTIWHALNHDLAECVTGDIPSNAKSFLRAKREMPELVPDQPPVGNTLDEIKMVKLADLIETYTWISMNGIGAHAVEVGMRMREEVYQYLGDCAKNGLVDTIRVDDLINSIIREEGRAYATGGELTRSKE